MSSSTCIRCKLPLTDETSVARGYGPECAMYIKREALNQGDLFSLRSSYQYGIEHGILWLEDTGHGAVKSLTNDMEQVLKEIKESEGDLSLYKIMYRDCYGEWDGVTYVNGRVDFFPIGETDRAKAFKKIEQK